MKKNYFLIALALLFLFSCTRDYLLESNDNMPVDTNSRVSRINFQEMENFIQKNTKKTLPNYLKTSGLNKLTESYITDIDTTDIIKVIHKGITSFTLKVNTLGDKDFTFSNLVIIVHNGKTQEFIYHYKPEDKWLKDYLSGKKGDYLGVLKIRDINGNDTISSSNAKNSTTCMVEMHVPCFGSGCPCSDYNGVTYYIVASCGGGSGGEGSGGGSPTDNPDGPPLGGLPGGGGGTVPNVPTIQQVNNFIEFLTPSTQAYITQNPNSLTDIYNYFILNGLAPKHQSFITSILEYVEKKDISWSNFSPIFASATAYKNQNPDNWTKISTIQDFAFDFMLQNSNITWPQFNNWVNWTSTIFENFPNEDKSLVTIFLSENVFYTPDSLLLDYKLQMSQEELNIYNQMSKNNQIHYLYAAKIALSQTQKLFPDSQYNGKGDAYRHALWNAIATRYLGNTKTEQLTTAHENRPSDPNNPFEFKEKEMDLFNNSIGRFIGTSYPPYETVNQVRLHHVNGYLKYLNNLLGGLPSGQATANSQLIPTNQ